MHIMEKEIAYFAVSSCLFVCVGKNTQPWLINHMKKYGLYDGYSDLHGLSNPVLALACASFMHLGRKIKQMESL